MPFLGKIRRKQSDSAQNSLISVFLEANEMDCQERICSLNQAIGRLMKISVRLMPACVLAVLTGCFFFVVLSVASEQVPRQGQPQVEELLKQLAHADFDQRESAERQLIAIGSPAVDSLLEELINCKPDVCSRIKRILRECAGKCDEESLYKVLGTLHLRFNMPDEQIELLLGRWDAQQRAAIVKVWRELGAVVEDPWENLRHGNWDAGMNLQQFRAPQAHNFQFRPNGAIKLPVELGQLEVGEQKTEEKTRSNAELIRLVLDGTLEQNKKLVVKSKTPRTQRPVTVTIGQGWKGDYSVFDFDGAVDFLPISSLNLQNLEINDSLLSAIKKHPLGSVAFTECSVAVDRKETLPKKIRHLFISGVNVTADILRLVSNQSEGLNNIQIQKSKFGETEASMLSRFPHLMGVELAGMDLEADAFDGLAAVQTLRRLKLERCKFPASAYTDFTQLHKNVRVDFKAKAFLGVSADSRRAIAGFPRVQAPVQGGCVVTTVVPDEGADRAGMKVGDEIIQISGQKVADFNELRIMIAQHEIGEEATIKVLRDGEELTLKAKMGTPSE